MRWYAQKDTIDTKPTRVTPDIKFSYLYKSVTFELELGTEDSTTPTSESKTRRNYGSLGYRWDFCRFLNGQRGAGGRIPAP